MFGYDFMILPIIYETHILRQGSHEKQDQLLHGDMEREEENAPVR